MLNENSSKLMRDLAGLLDAPEFQIDVINDGYSRASLAAMREELFHDFCALCLESGAPVPTMEKALITAQAPNQDKKTQEAHMVRIQNFAEPALKKVGRKNSAKAKATKVLAESFKLLPVLSAYAGQVTIKQMECLINQLLMELGQEPVRPDYSLRKVSSASSMPSAEKTVLVVDDDLQALFSTARGLAGWEGLHVSLLHQTAEGNSWNPDPEQVEAELSKTAQAVVEIKPDVVLMDQGLKMIEGHKLIGKIKEIWSQGQSPVFIANTSGSEDKLRAAGALPNCEKGRRLESVARAVVRS